MEAEVTEIAATNSWAMVYEVSFNLLIITRKVLRVPNVFIFGFPHSFPMNGHVAKLAFPKNRNASNLEIFNSLIYRKSGICPSITT